MRNMRRMFGPALLTAGVIALVGSTVGAQRPDNSQPRVDLADATASPKGQAKKFTRQQLENLEARVAIANALVGRFEAEAKGLGRRADIWRQSTLETLYGLSLPALQQVERNAHNADSLAAAVRDAADDPNLIGDPGADLVYTPINPCRYIDTRGGPIFSPAAPRGYDLVNNGATYGGVASCSLLQNVTAAIAANITIDQAIGAPAFLAVKPNLAAPTTSWMNWYENGTQLANAGVFTTDQTAADPEFFILVSSPTHVIVDFFGFFAEPEATAVDQQVLLGTENVAASAAFTVASPNCPAGWRAVGGGHAATFFNSPVQLASSRPALNGVGLTAGGINVANSWVCQGTNSATVQDHRCFVMCARIPGR